LWILQLEKEKLFDSVKKQGDKMRSFREAPLLKKEREAIVAAGVKLRQQFPVEKIILFGSKARGESDEHSDVDLLIITARPINWREERKGVEVLFDVGMEYDVIFSPLFVSMDDWDDEILRDGALAS
jgi:predicted nucleotidyltransferase